MFNKREEQEPAGSPGPTENRSDSATPRPAAARPPIQTPSSMATIGATVSIQGEISAEEDLLIEGRVKGTIKLKKNTLTIGSQGNVDAEVHAHTILVDGQVRGDLYASERISIRSSARIEGNLLAPRMSLEEGARFRGTIDMDPDSEALGKVFGKSAAAAPGPKPAPTGATSGPSGKPPEHGRPGEGSAQARSQVKP